MLVEAPGSLTAKELTEKAFDSETDEANTRYHIRELKRELKAAFPGFEEELLEGGAEGYRLKLRRRLPSEVPLSLYTHLGQTPCKINFSVFKPPFVAWLRTSIPPAAYVGCF
ncbi:MAG TPA: hypothetical protein VG122_24940 [Gemmata sp.]|nr:hypothetical protein [Gemmata sp.]